MSPVAALLVAVLLIACNATFVLIEYALLRVRSSRLELLVRKGSARARRVQELLAHLDSYLAACQLGITMVSLALGWIGEPALADLLRRAALRMGLNPAERLVHAASFALALGGLSWAHIVFGELLPRSIGIQRPESIALWGAHPLRLFYLLFRPLIGFMAWCSISLLRLLGMKSAAESDTVVSEEEMRVLLGETQERGALPFERLMLIENVLDLGQTKAAEIMVPRDKVVALSLAKSWQENLELVRARRYSRYPLCENGLEDVIGMVHVKDLLLRPESGGEVDWKRLRRDITEVRETDPLEKLLKSFPDRGIHMAVVRNGLGHVVGLLTLEDIVEELIGEVHDEFDLPHAWSLLDVIVPSAVTVQLQAASPREAITQLLERLAAAEPTLKIDEAFPIVWEREKKLSSAVGRGVAVPHGRLPNLARPLVAVGRFAKPIPFAVPDGMPVRLVFLILTPASTPVVQLKVLGRIAALVTNENLRRRLLRAKTAESLLESLRTADTLSAA